MASKDKIAIIFGVSVFFIIILIAIDVNNEYLYTCINHNWDYTFNIEGHLGGEFDCAEFWNNEFANNQWTNKCSINPFSTKPNCKLLCIEDCKLKNNGGSVCMC